MKTVVPSYYADFACIAGACRHTCCIGWEVDIDEESLARFRALPDVAPHVEEGEVPHIRLGDGERCPFLNGDGLCDMILAHGDDVLCGICRDHPRFRNYFTDRVEMGLGLVCEEAARLILGAAEPMTLVTLADDGKGEELPEDEAWLLEQRDRLLRNITEDGPRARLMEYLIYRHIPNALYDDRLEARVAFIDRAYREMTEAWELTDGSLTELCEITRKWSYDVEYDEEELERRTALYED